ncbi:MAG: orotate phosphoribosyltransferase, partial [Burkholderiaceae bacterium]|nr:orotate phosphoribosyltransferase [Burkholderiaceae bacterium]
MTSASQVSSVLDPALEQDFLGFALKAEVLRFGEFKTKAGRRSPYFFNAGLFRTGDLIGELAGFYARCFLKAVEAKVFQASMLFGPAYKGIPLAATTAMALSQHGYNLGFSFNRKEAKDHGEGGVIVGASLEDQEVVIIDDVISAGTSVRESVAIIQQAGGRPVGVLIALDRMEKGGTAVQPAAVSAVQEVRQTLGLPVVALAGLDGLLELLQGHTDSQLK